jgi:hypothetical protein
MQSSTIRARVRIMVFNATFNKVKISGQSRFSVLYSNNNFNGLLFRNGLVVYHYPRTIIKIIKLGL